MVYTANDIEKILEFSSWTTKQKQDELLRIDCAMYTNLGSDSLRSEVEGVRRESKKIYKAIRSINPEMGTSLLNALD